MLAGILSKLQQYLDATVSSRAPSSTALTTGTWTNTLASNLLSRVDAAISSRAASATALSNATWTDALAAALLNVKPIPKIKIAASGIGAKVANTGLTTESQLYFFPDGYSYTDGIAQISADYQFGLRRAASNDSSGVLVDVLNISTGGYLLGLHQTNTNISSETSQVVLIADGTTVYDSTYTSLSLRYTRLVLGKYIFLVTTGNRMALSDIPLRFNTSLRIQHRATSSTVYTEAIYIAD